MKPETKLKLRKWAVSTLRWIVWHADEWLHAQELQLREDLSGRKPRSETAASVSAKPVPLRTCLTGGSGRPEGETYRQWEARKSGVAVISKKQARRRRTAAEFDLRFAR